MAASTSSGCADATVLGLRFRPGRAPAFLGVPADALLNANVPLRVIWGGAAERLHAELELTSNTSGALATLQAAVSSRRAAAPATFHRVGRVWAPHAGPRAAISSVSRSARGSTHWRLGSRAAGRRIRLCRPRASCPRLWRLGWAESLPASPGEDLQLVELEVGILDDAK
jgi:hypothetical protein